MADQSLLLVEGKDDEHVLYHLLTHHKIPEAFQIKNKNGVENLLETLDVELLRSGLKRLGIMVDADTDLQRRWDTLRHILQGAGYRDVPATPDQLGTVITEAGLPIVGVWLMPDNTLPGMLEDFIRFLVPGNDALWPVSEQSVEQVMNIEQRFPMAHFSKALIHTWLAWQKAPGTPFGSAINEKFLSADAPHAVTLVAWIRRLFEPDAAP